MLSRLISLLSRIPAVKWAFNRLRPSPQGGSIDVAPIAANDSPALVADIAEATPSVDSDVTAEALHCDAGIEVAVPAAEDDTGISAIAEDLAAAPTGINVSDDFSQKPPADVEPIEVEEVSVSPVETESQAVDAPEFISNDLPAEFPANVEPVVEETVVSSIDVANEAAETPELINDDTPVELQAESIAAEEEAPVLSVETASAPVEAVELVTSNAPSPEPPADIDAVAAAEEAPVSSGGMDNAPGVTIELVQSDAFPSDVASDPSPTVAADIEPVAEQAHSSAIAVIVDEIRAAVSESSAASAPVLAALPSPAKRNRAPRTPTRAIDPADRATLIRQRWEQTGIRMWNRRLHGTGEATLNIQGRIELLPPEPGDSMPRYDKLEFKLLGGQIVCEGVVVEAPVSAGQRSFTRLAEPGRPAREPVRERRAVLA